MTINSKVIVVTSGKGGVGKTTTSVNLGAALALAGKSTVIVDFDIGLRNLDLLMGIERKVIFDFINVINGEATLSEALIQDKRQANLFVLPASQTGDKDSLTIDGVGKVISDLKNNFDYVICDSPAGIEIGAQMALYFADEAIIVTNPEISSLRDSDRMVGMLNTKTLRAELKLEIKKYLLITRYNQNRVKKNEMLSIEKIKEILDLPLLGIIPECNSILKASNEGLPVTLNLQKSNAKIGYNDAAQTLLNYNQRHEKNVIKNPKNLNKNVNENQDSQISDITQNTMQITKQNFNPFKSNKTDRKYFKFLEKLKSLGSKVT